MSMKVSSPRSTDFEELLASGKTKLILSPVELGSSPSSSSSSLPLEQQSSSDLQGILPPLPASAISPPPAFLDFDPPVIDTEIAIPRIRSPGTASSPDLKTLLRTAKAREQKSAASSPTVAAPPPPAVSGWRNLAKVSKLFDSSSSSSAAAPSHAPASSDSSPHRLTKPQPSPPRPAPPPPAAPPNIELLSLSPTTPLAEACADWAVSPSSVRLVKSPAVSLSPPSFQNQPQLQPQPQPPPQPLTDARRMAQLFWDEDEDTLKMSKETFAEFLGGQNQLNSLVLTAYMSKFDLTGMRLDIAFRSLCAKLWLKAESQQIDRILVVFATRYTACNPSTIWLNSDVVHAVAYSLLLVNTDLHIADVPQHMSRSQYVKNTMSVILAQVDPPVPPEFSNSETGLQPHLSPHFTISTRSPDMESIRSGSTGTADWPGVTSNVGGNYMQHTHPNSPYGQRMSSSPASASTGNLNLSRRSLSLVSVNAHTPSLVYLAPTRAWELDVESALRDLYTAVRSAKIRNPVDDLPSRPSMSSLPLSIYNRDVGRKSPSLRHSSLERNMPLKRGSIRGLQALLSGSVASSETRTVSNGTTSSNGDIHSHITANPSSSLSAPSLGFASNLSQSIIREHEEIIPSNKSINSSRSRGSSRHAALNEEDLALRGAPWAKEGSLVRKHYFESDRRRAKGKAKDWLEVFVVVGRGELKMFTFRNQSAKQSSDVGGGNWLNNANQVGCLSLLHSMSSALSAPYNRSREHCFAVTLPGGSCWFFQAGTSALVEEWVNTCNYWAARTSQEPLQGGVSNMEYGWNRVLPGAPPPELPSKLIDDDVRSQRSVRSRTSFSTGLFHTRTRTNSENVEKQPMIAEWSSPYPPESLSTLPEDKQLERFTKHVGILKAELEEHTELHAAMLNLYPTRSTSSIKAKENWEHKSHYLLTEIVKFDKYIESLIEARELQAQITIGERETGNS